MTTARDSLTALIGAEAAQPISASASALVSEILRRHEAAAAAVLFYGSCLRAGDPVAAEDPVFDFYLLVDDYRRAYGGGITALANALLPPNVFYLEAPWRGRTLRAKYAVVSLAQFRRALSPRAFHSYFWARFAQPVRLAYVRDESTRAAVTAALADAVVTFATRAAGLLDARFTLADLWTRGFAATYGAELRAERGERAQLLYEADRERYDALTAPALEAAGLALQPAPDGRLSILSSLDHARDGALSWWLRRLVGKMLSILRLAKGVFTFDGGIDYILWKIERHSGVKATATPWQRRHPLLAAPALAWRLYRRGAFR